MAFGLLSKFVYKQKLHYYYYIIIINQYNPFGHVLDNYVLILYISSMPNITSGILVTVFVTVAIYTYIIFHMEFVGSYMIYHHTKFHISVRWFIS
jgi:hypothetical protein